MLKKSASPSCSFGLSGLSDFLVEQNQPDKQNKPDQPDRPSLFKGCGP
jgi:hypothetical protein